MRLLNTETLEVEEFLANIPIYAILSHTWEQDEVAFQDIQDLHKAEKKAALEVENARKQVQLSKVERIKKKAGWLKIKKACDYVRKYKFKWIWIDTCCIDKSSSAELSEALNSMYKYYGDARICIAYLNNVSNWGSVMGLEGFKKSRWFERGWTLQELIAPRYMVFLDQDWEMIGTRFSMRQVISEVTSIPVRVFERYPGGGLEHYSIAQKMSWAASRRTTREEDMAYCLMGLFGVNMPPIYGEGGAKAFMRLQQEIIKYSHDRTIFAWIAPENDRRSRGLFASSPLEFSSSGEIHESYSEELGDKTSFSFGNNGLRIHLSLQGRPDIGDDIFFASLHCRDAQGLVGIYLRKDGHRYVRWCPHFPLHRTEEPAGNLEEVVVKESTVPRQSAVVRKNMISTEFEVDLDPELTLLGEGDNDGALHNSRQSPSFLPSSCRFRLRTRNGTEFEIALINAGDDVFPVELSHGLITSNDYRHLQDSRLLPIDDGNALPSCFIHRMGDSDRKVVKINYIPSSNPEFEYYRQIDELEYTSNTLSSTTLNFIIDTVSHSFVTHLSSSPFYPSDLRWERDHIGYKIYGSISYPSDQRDIHCVFECNPFGIRVCITLGLRTDSERRIPWIDVCVSDNGLQILDVWQSYQPLGSRYECRHQNRLTATFDDNKSLTFTVEEKKVLGPPWYHVVITGLEERCELKDPIGGETEIRKGREE